jgi:hypothetical protein
MITRHVLKSSSLLLALVLGSSGYANATDAVVLVGHPQSLNWTVRHVNVYGTYAIAPNEQITDVRLYFSTRDNFGHILSGGQVQGTFDPVHKTWGIQYGDYQLYSYYAVVTVQNGHYLMRYSTPVFYW